MSTVSDNNKRIAKNTIILYIRMLCTMIIGLYTSRVVLNTLGITDYGIYNIVGGIIAIFSFINSSMAGASSRFITYELGQKNLEKLKIVFANSLTIHLIIAIIILILGETIGLWFIYEKVQIPSERFETALTIYHISIFTTILSFISVPYNSTIIAHEKMSAFAYISILEVLLKLLIAYLLVLIPFDKLIVYAILLLIVQVIYQSIYVIYSFIQFKETRTFIKINREYLKKMASFAGWNLFGNIAFTLFTQGQNLLLNMFFGPVVNAARGISIQVQNVLYSFVRNFQTALNPQIIKSYASNDLKNMHNLIFTSSRFSYFLMLIITVPIFLKTKYILILWLTEVPNYTSIFLKIILIISLTETLSNPLMIAAQSTGNIRKYQQIVGGILLCILPLSYLSLKLGFDAYSVFIVHLFCIIIAQIVRVLLISKMINLSIKEYNLNVLKKISIVTICIIPISIVLEYIFSENDIINLFSLTICSIILNICLIYFLGLKHNERILIVNRARNFLKTK